jgi:hypothetical protein
LDGRSTASNKIKKLKIRRDKNVTRIVALNVVGDCWEWPGGTHNSGYGMLVIGGKQLRAHRVIYESEVGPIHAGMIVCHKCDNRKCCRPDHLFLGTHSDNAADRNAKGRQARGERHGRAKLTDAQVIAILEDDRPAVEVAGDYGVGRNVVWTIRRLERLLA